MVRVEGYLERSGGRRSPAWAVPWLLLGPTLVLLAALVFYPLAAGMATSLTQNQFLSNAARFVGLTNYLTLAQDPTFWQVAGQSLIWTATVVAGQFVLGLLGALAFNQRLPGLGVLRAVSLIPWAMPGVAAGLLWSLLYSPYFGLVGEIERLLGQRAPVAYLADTRTALWAVILVAIWKGSPFSLLMYLAGLQTVDPAVVEAARLDGTSGLQTFRYAIWPQMDAIFRVTLLFTTVWTFNYFDIIYVMTNGGPVDATHIFPTYVFHLAFGELNFGLGAAAGVLSLAVIAVIAALFVRSVARTGGFEA